MAEINFYPEKRKDKQTEKIIVRNVPVFLYFSFNGNRLQHFTGYRVDIKNWDYENQKVKRNVDGGARINQEIDKLKVKVQGIYDKAKALEITPTVSYFRAELKGEKSTKKSFWKVFDEYTELRKTQSAANTIKKYKSTSNHLQGFETFEKIKITFEIIDLTFFSNFYNYLAFECKQTNNTIAKYIKTFKQFMKYASKQGYNKNLEFMDFVAKEEDGEIIFLTWDELLHLFNLEIESEALRQVRDVFCFGCFTGLRYSDIHNLSKSNITDDYINLKTIKTKESNKVPLNDYSKEILTKYQDYPGEKALPVISNQKMNEHLKDLGKLAEIKYPITVVHYRGAERIETTLPKYQFITTHVARKTFITNALKKKMQSEVIMSITGHKTHQSFKRYYKVVDEQKLDAMKEFFKKEPVKETINN